MKNNLLFLLSCCILLSAPSASFAAVEIFLDPPSREVNIGDTFLVNVRVKTDSECVNAIGTEIHFDPEVLRAVDFSTGQSLISLWTEPSKINKEKGTIIFSGGIPGGYCGRIVGDPGMTNILGKIVFSTSASLLKQALPLSTKVDLKNTEVLLNDGLGTNAEATVMGSDIFVANTGKGVINEWMSEVNSDIIAPELFTLEVYRDPNIKDGKYFIVWATQDKQSGIDHFEILETNPWKFGFFRSNGKEADWTKAESPYILKDQNLRSKIMVKAIDKMGNERIVEYNPKTSVIPGVDDRLSGSTGAIAIVIIILGIYYWRIIYPRGKKNNN